MDELGRTVPTDEQRAIEARCHPILLPGLTIAAETSKRARSAIENFHFAFVRAMEDAGIVWDDLSIAVAVRNGSEKELRRVLSQSSRVGYYIYLESPTMDGRIDWARQMSPIVIGALERALHAPFNDDIPGLHKSGHASAGVIAPWTGQVRKQ